MKNFSLLTYTFSHFLVDYVCISVAVNPLHDSFRTPEYALGIIVYNFIAFGLQMIFGNFCDSHKKLPAGALGCLLVLIGGLASGQWRWEGIILVGLGNALFHVGGGIDGLVNSGGKLSRSGIFVSSGALGVALAVFDSTRERTVPAPLILLAVCAVLCLVAHEKCGTEGKTEFKGIANGKSGLWLVLCLALVSVVIRSFGGTVIPMEWKTAAEFGLVSGFAAFFGKFIGGFAADKFGAKTTGVFTLLLSIPFLIFGSGNMYISVIGIILFNMTMPITLGICAERLPKNPGLAFGLTTAALLIGAVPSFFVVLGGNTALLIPAVLISAVCIFFAADNKKSLSEVEK